MSQDRVFVCCDDGEIYRTDMAAGPGWIVSFEEDGLDELWLSRRLLPKGIKLDDIPAFAMKLACIARMPIVKLGVLQVVNGHVELGDFYTLLITWESGKAFPRSLLPPVVGKKRPGETGTLCCYTKSHRGK